MFYSPELAPIDGIHEAATRVALANSHLPLHDAVVKMEWYTRLHLSKLTRSNASKAASEDRTHLQIDHFTKSTCHGRNPSGSLHNLSTLRIRRFGSGLATRVHATWPDVAITEM